jgi:hypothetical protein
MKDVTDQKDGAVPLGKCLWPNRNKQKAGDAAESIKRASGNKDVHSFAADLSSMSQVRQLAAEVKAAHPKINVLSNNAGVFSERMQVSHSPEPTQHVQYARWRRKFIWVEEKKKTCEKTIKGWRKVARGEITVQKYTVGKVMKRRLLWAGWILNAFEHFQAKWNQVSVINRET